MRLLEKSILKRVAQMWFFVRKDNPAEPRYLGSAGNPHKTDYPSFVRKGNSVIVSVEGEERARDILSANDVVIAGVSPEKADWEDRLLQDVLEEDTIYGYDLMPVSTSQSK